jgi:hypothetical protein
VVGRRSSHTCATRSDPPSGSPHEGPISTSPETRSGWAAAASTEAQAPADRATTAARSVPVASITATMSSPYWDGVCAAAPAGRSERPLPRPSKVTTR